MPRTDAPDRCSAKLVGIDDLHLIPTGYERLLPPGVQMTVRTRRRAMTRRLDGRILDLGGSEAHRSLWRDRDDVTVLDGVADPAFLSLVDRDERFDAIVSVFQLATVADLAGTLSRVRRLLTVDGQFHFIEPARRTGMTGRAQRIAAPMVTLSTGIRLDRDIPAELRANGLSVTSLERHRTPSTQWWLSRLVEGVAHHSLLPH